MIRGVGLGSKNYGHLSRNTSRPLSEGKIKRDPTEEQLKHIEESQEREKEWLSEENHQLVPIDWDYIKETINLTKEEAELRHQQELEEIDRKFEETMAGHEKEYREAMDKIDRDGAINEDRVQAANLAKAMAIIAEVRSGHMVSPFDMMFAQDVAPEELAQAVEDAKKMRESSPYGGLEHMANMVNIRA